MDIEEPLTGGNASAEVVRVGSTVRKPWLPTTPSVHGYVTHLIAAGIDAPRPLGRDDRGRQILEYVDGTLAQTLPRFGPDDLRRVGALVRAIHDASTHYPVDHTGWDVLLPAPDADLICHNDLAPWNLVVGERWVFIDFDGAGPSTRLWDLAYAAQSFAGLNPDELDGAADRLTAFITGYDADDDLRAGLPDAMTRRAQASYDRLRDAHANGEEPWASMFLEGHGDYWGSVARFLAANSATWAAALR
ncbi:phosphotransferase [Microlunatus sp. GCM10028923]|uniref:phosphotransferase n=1 Tax=Microlunatus sp. GCM10028923 TaxID=3273400 RepID=UPI003616F5C3